MIKKKLKEFIKRIKTKLGTKRLLRESVKPNCRIVIGSSNYYDKGWTPTEVDYLNLLKEEDWTRFFKPDSINAILAEHVWEHLTETDALLAAKMCFKYLKKGGYLRIAVPDGYHTDPEYINTVKPNGTGWGSDDHKVLYNIDTFTALFVKAGFVVKPLEYFSKEGKFIANEWSVKQGTIMRSAKMDWRNKNGQIKYTSLMIDACKI